MHIHQYEPIFESKDGTAERCRCGHRIITKKGNKGRIDNKQYLLDHVADTAQPTGRTSKIYKQLYGNKNGK